MLSAATDVVETVLGESYAKELQKIVLADNNVGGRILDISRDLCDQLIDLPKISCLAFEVDEASLQILWLFSDIFCLENDL